MEKFSDISQADLLENETTDIPIFNVPEIISFKIISPQSEKNTLSLKTKKNKKADKLNESIQALFDYMAEDIHASVALSSKTAEIFKVINFTSLRNPKPKPIVAELKSDSSSDSSIINKLIKSESNNLLRPMVKKSAR